MERYLHAIQKSSLFAGLDEPETGAMLDCLGATLKSYPKGACVLAQGETVTRLMVLAQGRLHIQRDDYWGNRSIVSEILPGEMFGEAYLTPGSGALMNDVMAVESSTVCFLDATPLLSAHPPACRFHWLAARNLLFVLSEKNRRLVGRLGIATRRATRDRLIAFLSDQARRQGSSAFEITFNRQQLADYLCVDRSAMSHELCKMRDEGLLRFHKNHFELFSAPQAD